MLATALWGQIETGVLSGVIVDGRGRPVSGASVVVEGGPAAFKVETAASAGGEFQFTLPYGSYHVTAGPADFDAHIPPLGSVCAKVALNGQVASATLAACPESAQPRVAGALSATEPTTVAEPPWTGQFGTPSPLTLLSQRAFSWTDVRYAVAGADASDPYQPGRLLPGVPVADEVILRTGFSLEASKAYGSEIAAFGEAPPSKWHASASTSDSGGALASDNLPPPITRGLLQQTGKYHSYTDDGLLVGGPAGRRVDWLASVRGQWSSQTVPLAKAGSDQQTRYLLASGIARVQVTSRDQLQFDFSGSRLHLSDWGMPAGIEAWLGRRMSPSFTLPSVEGFPETPENDSFYSFQTTWYRVAPGGTWQARIASSRARLETTSEAPLGAQSAIDLASGAISGAAPLASLGTRARTGLAAGYEPALVVLGSTRHLLAVGADWGRAGILNRFNPPSDLNLITVNRQPAFAVVFNATGDSRPHIRNFAAHARDEIALWPWLKLDLAVVADSARGGPIAWNSVSPRVGFAASPGGFRRLTLRGGYARLYAPLAGRYLDFGDPNSLGGLEYQWIDRNGDGRFQPGDTGALLTAFGGPYSSIDPALRRPYADEINVGAEVTLPLRSFARSWFFRRDEKDRLAAVNVGVLAARFNPISILDPGPDAIPGTFDDQTLTVYAQQPASFGKDRYMLTNPAGLRTLGEGVVLEVGSQYRSYGFHASFMAVKSYGPSNPGNSPLENDPGVVGSLYSDPNSLINASGRHFFDRAYVGKTQFYGTLPKFLGGIQWENTMNYMDGAAFARRLVVAGLPQGPFLIDATVRGSPGGGNRAEYLFNWNLRLGRVFSMPKGNARASLDIVNVTNNANRIREIDTSGPAFNQRLPIEIAPARFVRLNLQYAF